MHRVEIVAYTASESLVFGASMHKLQTRLKKLNFNCRWSKKIVDVSHMISDNYYSGSTTIKNTFFLRVLLNYPGEGGLDGNGSTNEEINGITKQRENLIQSSF